MCDDRTDDLLKEALGGPRPALAPEFTDRVVRRLHARRLTMADRIALGLYGLGASGVAFWAMRGLTQEWVTVALAGSICVAAAASAYGRRLVQP